MNLRIFLHLLLLAVTAIIPVVGHAHARIPYEIYQLLSITDLYERAEKYTERQMPDSALACYAMCALKYQPSLSTKEKEMTVNAMRKEARGYFYDFYEFDIACDRLAQATDLCKREGLNSILPQIMMEQAGVYATYSLQNPDSTLKKKSEELYREAFRLAYNQGDINVMSTCFANLSAQFHGDGRLPELSEEFRMFGQKARKDTTPKYLFSRILFDGYSEILKQNPRKARQIFLIGAGNEDLTPRHKFKLIVSAIRLFLAENKVDSAISLEHRLLALCEAHNLKDGKAVVLRDLGTLYKAIGDSANAEHYTMLGLLLKDTLLHVNHLDKAKAMPFLEEMHRLHDDALKSQKTKRGLHYIIIGLVCLIVLIFLIWIKIHKKNRREMANAMAALDRYRREQTSEPDRTEGPAPETSADATQPASTVSEAATEKYRSSRMDDFTFSVLSERVRSLLTEENEELFAPGFSIDDAAKRVKSNTKYVSQVINQTYHCNFSTLLSTIRIREAIRRIEDPLNYGNMTFEAIGASVGFGSRASFNAAFKRLTGKTPREYRASLAERPE